ncbi:unnamed protein product, partial [Aphanomyces euteiches]
EAWQATLAKLNSTYNIKYNIAQLKARHTEMKKLYSQVVQMVKTSGVGFETSTCRFFCTEGMWSHFLQGRPKKWALWSNKRFPQYPYCQELYDGTLATGEISVASNQPLLPTISNIASSSVDMPVDDFEPDVEVVHGPRDAETEAHDFLDGDDAIEEEDTTDTNNERRRRRNPCGAPVASKRVRPSLVSMMVEEMKAFRQSGRTELELIRETLNGSKDQNPIGPVAKAIEVLQDDFDHILLNDEMSFAFEVVKDSTKAIQFLHMRGDARMVWLRRQIERKERENEAFMH